MLEITRKGVKTVVEGTQPKLYKKAPHFSLYNLDNQVVTLDSLKGRKAIISVFPDINTRVCDLQALRFFNIASTLDNVAIVNVSNNTKEELKDWCALKQVSMEMLTDDNRSFATAYGLWMPEFERLARSIFVLDEDGTLIYSEIVPEMASEPNYDAAISATK